MSPRRLAALAPLAAALAAGPAFSQAAPDDKVVAQVRSLEGGGAGAAPVPGSPGAAAARADGRTDGTAPGAVRRRQVELTMQDTSRALAPVADADVLAGGGGTDSTARANAPAGAGGLLSGGGPGLAGLRTPAPGVGQGSAASSWLASVVDWARGSAFARTAAAKAREMMKTSRGWCARAARLVEEKLSPRGSVRRFGSADEKLQYIDAHPEYARSLGFEPMPALTVLDTFPTLPDGTQILYKAGCMGMSAQSGHDETVVSRSLSSRGCGAGQIPVSFDRFSCRDLAKLRRNAQCVRILVPITPGPRAPASLKA